MPQTQQDRRAWFLYCMAVEFHKEAPTDADIAWAWGDLPIELKTKYRMKANTEMLDANAPHKHP